MHDKTSPNFGQARRDRPETTPHSQNLALTVDEALPAHLADLPPEQLVEAIWADQRRRWQNGNGVAARRYLERYPTLAADSELAADLVYHEFIVREELGVAPAFEEYLDEYAPYAARLRDLHEVDHLVKLPLPPARPVQSQEQFGDYELLAEIGRGGMGVVYRARQVSLKRIVAVKVLLAGERAAEVDRQRFRYEAEAAGHLQHPNIVAVHEVGEHNGQPYLSMDYIEGKSLAALVRENLLPAATAATYVKTIALAIHYAHQQGTLHRDLKPANILIDVSGQPRITDFGLAKRIEGDSQLTATGDVLGTPSYMSPEQAAGKRRQVGPASDIYSLGAILYELLTGRPPFRADTPFDTLLQVVETDAATPRRLNPKVPRDLETICLKCLEKEPGKRYASGNDLAEDLGRFLKGEPIRARPPLTWERGLKWAKRRPALAALAAVSAVAVLTVLAVVLLTNARLQQERDYADQKRVEAENNFQEAQEQRRQALANFRKARDAVDRITELARDQLQNVPQTETLRRDLLTDVVKFYQDFAQEKSNDPDVLCETGRAYRRLGELDEAFSDLPKAQQAYRQALETQEGILMRFPDLAIARRELAMDHLRLGVGHFYAGRRREAEERHRQALSLQERLLAESPEDRDYRGDLAITHNWLGMTLSKDSKRLPEAEISFRRSMELMEQLAARFPAEPRYRTHLALPRNNLAELLQANGHLPEAENAFRQNLELWEDLAARYPAAADHRSKLCLTLQNLAEIWARTSRTQEAERALRRTWDLRLQIAKDFPNMPFSQSRLADSLHRLAELVAERGDLSEARQLFEMAISHRSNAKKMAPEDTGYLQMLGEDYGAFAEFLLQIQDHARAAKIATEIAVLFPLAPQGLVDAARVLARCVPLAENDARLAEDKRQQFMGAYSEQALQLLREAIRKGGNIDHLKDSPKLDKDTKQRLADWVEKAKQMNED